MRKARELVDVYIASDGSHFYNKEQCEKHELQCAKDKNPVWKYRIEDTTNPDNFSATLFYITSQEDYDFALATKYCLRQFASKKNDTFDKCGEGWYMLTTQVARYYFEFLDNYVARKAKELDDWKHSIDAEIARLNEERKKDEERTENG